jgi:predicted short-subunit dehydrogenase-like oxidoreductase (DUF2520 family)
MSARISEKPRIAIVGAGNLASALALALRAAGYVIEQIVSRPAAASLRKARKLARKVQARSVAVDASQIGAEIVWFCVPDGEIKKASRSLVEACDWRGKIALHSSGALTSDALKILRGRGAAVASVHPMMTFVHGSRPALEGLPFAIEGDRKAVNAAREIVINLQGQPHSVSKRRKENYHAWGMFASPLLIALLAAAERVAGAAGVNRKDARKRMLPILRQTLANYQQLGAPESFSGPIARGDVETVTKHLKSLSGIAGAREIYIALAQNALQDLPAKNRTVLGKILGG